MRLKLFPFTLKDKAKIWLNSLRPRSIRTWTELQADFLKKFFPTHRTNGLKRQISNFSARENEKFYECWERYMEAINACPHHGFDTWLLVGYFYDGMSSSMKQILETMCGGDFMSKNPEEAMDFLSLCLRGFPWMDEPTNREIGKRPVQQMSKGGMYNLSEDMEMKAKVAAMARKIEEMELRKVHEVQAISEPQQPANPCSICQSFEHMVEECPTIPAVREMFGEQANLIGQWKPNSNAPYGNTYNSSWRNHPNFAWKPRPNPYQSPAQSSQQSQGQSSVEQALVSLSKVMGDFVSEQKSINSQLNQKIDNVESTLNKKIDGMYNELSQKIDNIQYSISRLTNLNTVNEKGKFPSQPHLCPKGIHEVESKDEDSSKVRDVQAIITLRSGKEVHQPEHDQRKTKEDKADRNEEKKNERKGKEHMPPPFPQALRGKKPIKNASEILDVLRQVKVNIPLLDMIKQVPTYAKFLKDLCTVKRGLNVTKQAFLTEQVSAIIQCKSPIKYKDPGCPTISVNIGGTQVEKALLDLGASVNLLPYSVYKELGLGELKSTSITLSLADRSVKIPRGINYVPIILGRPFLATSNAIINHIHPEEDEGPEEVCMIDTLVEQHCNQSMLDQFEENPNESHEDLDDGLAKPMGMNAVMSNWRQKPVILPLFKDEEEMKEAKDEILKLELKTFLPS
ncbi:hypothetical protein CK203_060446 [Vitis vinifera]|uniref:Retrotransposon gag domain-containing protein n=1 Tax=Vitis vinifera TaxID=29760 RepID=A0A438FR68_VITVI|nr:hypothetical protein CK203_060446 [Vitis vinifera]